MVVRKASVKSSITHLYVDISNSWIKLAAGNLEKIQPTQRMETANLTEARIRYWHKQWPKARLILSSVVPTRTALIRRVWGNNLHILTHRSRMPITIDYPKPSCIGADRLANAIAMQELYGGPAIIVDFGTAVTFDVINERGAYIGGVIAPGLNVMMSYLYEKTALLPLVTLREPNKAIGKSTEEAMRIGAVVGYRGLVKEIVEKVGRELDAPRGVRLVATGGYAELIAREIPGLTVHPQLTLVGLQIIARMEKK